MAPKFCMDHPNVKFVRCHSCAVQSKGSGLSQMKCPICYDIQGGRCKSCRKRLEENASLRGLKVP